MQSETWSPSVACSQFVSGLKFEDIPAEVVDAIKRAMPIGSVAPGAAQLSHQLSR